jgi:hypothetical protein
MVGAFERVLAGGGAAGADLMAAARRANSATEHASKKDGSSSVGIVGQSARLCQYGKPRIIRRTFT